MEAACAGNPALKKYVISHELAQFNFAMAGQKDWLYVEAQPGIDYEIAMAGDAIMVGLDEVVGRDLVLNPHESGPFDI